MREVIKLEIDSIWYKEVILYNLTSSVTLTISKEEAEGLKAQLEEAGASVEIK